jgi:hypothetical protein
LHGLARANLDHRRRGRAFLENAVSAVGKDRQVDACDNESVLLDARDGLLVHHPAVLPIEIVLVFATACFTIVITLGP